MSLAKGARVMVSGRIEQRSWENELGERRTKVEIVADEVGPSLRFATADVHRTERPGTGGPLPTQDDDDDELEEATAPSGAR
jgi:single-strand DNA-binding protein